MRDLCDFGITYDILDNNNDPADEITLITFRHQSFQSYFAACQIVMELTRNKIGDFKTFVQERTNVEKRTYDAWLEVFNFFAELDGPRFDHTSQELFLHAKEILAHDFLSRYYDGGRHEMLYSSAKILSFLPTDRAQEIREEIRKALVKIVEVSVEIVLPNEKPFKALRDINETEYLAQYSANQKSFNSVNRLYAFKYAFTSLGGEDLKITSEVENVLHLMSAPGSTTKPDFMFALNRHPSDQVVKYYLPFFEKALTPAIPYISTFLDGYLKFKDDEKKGGLLCFYDEWIVPLREEAKHVAFYVSGNPLYGRRSHLTFLESIGLPIFERQLRKYIYKNKTGQWKGYEDACMVILGALGNRKIGESLFEHFLNKKVTKDGDKYKQAIAAFALACCFPGDQCTQEDQLMVNKVTERCISVFDNDVTNPYRYYVAAALTVIGNQRVIDYFLDFIQRRTEKQRWFATMVLGSLDNPTMISRLENLVKSKDTDEETKLFASQALLVYSQNQLMQSK